MPILSQTSCVGRPYSKLKIIDIHIKTCIYYLFTLKQCAVWAHKFVRMLVTSTRTWEQTQLLLYQSLQNHFLKLHALLKHVLSLLRFAYVYMKILATMALSLQAFIRQQNIEFSYWKSWITVLRRKHIFHYVGGNI